MGAGQKIGEFVTCQRAERGLLFTHQGRGIPQIDLMLHKKCFSSERNAFLLKELQAVRILVCGIIIHIYLSANCSHSCDNCACAFSASSWFSHWSRTSDRSGKPPGRGAPRCGLSSSGACPGFFQRLTSHMPEQ